MADMTGGGPTAVTPAKNYYQTSLGQDANSPDTTLSSQTPGNYSGFGSNPFAGGNFANNWDDTMGAIFNATPSDAITNLFEQAGLSLNNPYLNMYKSLAPGMQWLDLIGNGINSTAGSMGNYMQGFLRQAMTPGAHMGLGNFGSDMGILSNFLGNAFANAGAQGQAGFNPLATAVQGLTPNDALGAVGDIVKSMAFASGMNPFVLQGIMGQLGQAQDALAGMPQIFENIPAGSNPVAAALNWLKGNGNYAGNFISTLLGG